VQHWRSLASAVLALGVFELERLANFKLQLSKDTFGAVVVNGFRAVLGFYVIVIWATPRNWTAIVLFVVHRNTAVNDATSVAQRNTAIDLDATRVLLDRRRVGKVLCAVTLVAATIRVDLLTFTVRLTFEHAC